jgi:hypothetical protein
MESQWHDPHIEFLQRLAFQRATRIGNDLSFLKSLRHRWDIVTGMHKFMEGAFQDIFGQSIFDLVIYASERPLTASSIAQIETPREKSVFPNVHLPESFISSFPSEIIGLLKQFVGESCRPEPQVEEHADLPGDGSFPMVQTMFPMIKVV